MCYLFKQMFTICIDLYCAVSTLNLLVYLWSRLFELSYDTTTATRNSFTLHMGSYVNICFLFILLNVRERQMTKRYTAHSPNLKRSCIYNSHCCRLSSFSILFLNEYINVLFMFDSRRLKIHNRIKFRM